MTCIRVHCVDCGHEPSVHTSRVTVELHPAADTGRMWWQCPNCRTWEDQPLSAYTIELLSQLAGVTWVVAPRYTRGLTGVEYAELHTAQVDVAFATDQQIWDEIEAVEP